MTDSLTSKEIVARLQRMAGGHSCNKEGCLDCFYRTAAREIERLLEADRLLQQSWMRPAGEVDQNHLEQEVWNYFGRASDETFDVRAENAKLCETDGHAWPRQATFRCFRCGEERLSVGKSAATGDGK